jgi:hypothetical protein
MPHDLTNQCEELQPQLAAYALGEGEADAAMLAHLERCPDCRHDLRAYTQIARALPYSAPDIAPPASLRERILAAAAQEQQDQQPAPLPAPPAAPARRPRRAPARWAAFAGALAIMIALLGWNISLRNQVAGQQEMIQGYRDTWRTMIVLLNDPAVGWYALAGGPSYGQLWASPQGRVGCLVAEGLPDLAADQTYQVWLVRGTQRQNGGVFDAHGGNAWVLLEEEQPLAAYESIMITVEPQAGSAWPTGREVMHGTLAAAHTPSSADRQELALLLAQARARAD